MKTRSRPFLVQAVSLAAAAVILSACNMLSRLSDVGSQPQLTTIQNPTTKTNYQPVNMPMPPPVAIDHNPSSLWRPGARSFFKDTRASQVGDLITVIITIDDDATITNTTTRGRTNTETMGVDYLLGYEQSLAQILPQVIDNQNLLSTDSALSNEGTGTITRGDEVNLRLAATIIQVLPNGNLVISGHQEVRVNYEVKVLRVSGIIRKEDITAINTVNYDQIAEARINYSGHGQITDIQQPRYGSQILDVLMPF